MCRVMVTEYTVKRLVAEQARVGGRLFARLERSELREERYAKWRAQATSKGVWLLSQGCTST